MASRKVDLDLETNMFLRQKKLEEKNPEILECYELLTMHYLQQFQDEEVWQNLIDWCEGTLSPLKLIVNLPKELWFIAIFINENPWKLKKFMTDKCSLQSIGEEEHLLSSYLKAFNLTELYLDTTFRSSDTFDPNMYHTDVTGRNLPTNQEDIHRFVRFEAKPPVCIFRCCPNVRVLSLKSNNLELIPPEIGRLRHLKQLYLTNNRLQNGSIPYTLEFCTNLEELYLDDNLLDALPSILLRIKSLKKVHRHGNHNYFKSTFMWYHTDVTGRILPTNPAQEDIRYSLPPIDQTLSLQNLCSKAIIASRINFYVAEIPFRLTVHLSELINYVNLCEKCSMVKNMNEAGYKVFTFRNPYLGNTCVPFLHWACDYECASEIEIPARKHQIMSAIIQDKMYEDYVRQAVDLMPMPTRSLSNLSIQTNGPSVESSQDDLIEEPAKQGSMGCQII